MSASGGQATRCTLCNYTHLGAEDPERCERHRQNKRVARKRTLGCPECGYTHYRPRDGNGCATAAENRARVAASKAAKRPRLTAPAGTAQTTPVRRARFCAECGSTHLPANCPAEHPHKEKQLRRSMRAAGKRAAKARLSATQTEQAMESAQAATAEDEQKAAAQEQLLRDVNASNNPFHPHDTFLLSEARLKEFRQHRTVDDVHGMCGQVPMLRRGLAQRKASPCCTRCRAAS